MLTTVRQIYCRKMFPFLPKILIVVFMTFLVEELGVGRVDLALNCIAEPSAKRGENEILSASLSSY